MLPFPRVVHFLPLKGKGCCVSLGTGSGCLSLWIVGCGWRRIVLCGLWLLRNPTSVGDIADGPTDYRAAHHLYIFTTPKYHLHTAMQSDIVYTLKHHQYNQLQSIHSKSLRHVSIIWTQQERPTLESFSFRDFTI